MPAQATESTGAPLAIGDRVAIARKLARLNPFDFGHARGTVVGITVLGSSWGPNRMALVEVDWDGAPDVGRGVGRGVGSYNLTRVDRLHLEPA